MDFFDPECCLVDLKTLAQFSLLGDPSVHPVGRAPHALEHSRVWRRALGPVDGGEQGRKNRREWIVRYSLASEEVIGATRHRSGAQPSAAVRAALEATAREAGVRRVQFSTHVVHDPVRRRIKSRLGERHVPASVYVATGSAPAGREGGSADDKRTVVLIATVERGRIVAMRRVDRR